MESVSLVDDEGVVVVGVVSVDAEEEGDFSLPFLWN